jgi:ubiquinone biosynthesis monooxygenase Coq7
MSMLVDRFILQADKVLRTLAAPPRSVRPVPGNAQPESLADEAQRRRVAGLMRINHVGEICAQALYQGQAITARADHARAVLEHAAEEETEHLAWTLQRIRELGGRPSLFNPVWYGGALAIGVAAGLAGDRWSLGFLAETERQVEAHLNDHLTRTPEDDLRTRAILQQMREDEAAHAEMAHALGGAELPLPVRAAMKLASRVMTSVAYYV